MEYSPYQDSYYQPRRKSVPEILIEHILVSITAVFFIVLGFVIVSMAISSIDNTSVSYKSYTETFDTTAGGTVYYTSNPILSSITITRYWTANSTTGTMDSSRYSYDDDDGSITISPSSQLTGVEYITVTATADVSEAPYETFFSTLGIGLIIGSIATLFGIIGYSYYRNNYY